MRRDGSPQAALSGAASWLAFALLGCAPAVNPAPLGLGPLAIAERDAERDAKAHAAASQHPRGARRAAVATASPEGPGAKVEVPAAAVDDKDGDGDSEGSPVTATATPSFEGLYAGDDIAVFRLTGFPEREQRDDKAQIRIEWATADSVSITLINSEDGSDLCELLARVEGNAALIESAQPCFSSGGEGSLEAELTSGRAVLEGDQLRMNAEGTLSVAFPDQELDGELTYSFEGERQ